MLVMGMNLRNRAEGLRKNASFGNRGIDVPGRS